MGGPRGALLGRWGVSGHRATSFVAPAAAPRGASAPRASASSFHVFPISRLGETMASSHSGGRSAEHAAWEAAIQQSGHPEPNEKGEYRCRCASRRIRIRILSPVPAAVPWIAR